MPYIVKIDKPCSCFFKNEIEELREFDTLKEAQDYSKQISYFANNSFCHTHFYSPEDENENEIMVRVRLRPRT